MKFSQIGKVEKYDKLGILDVLQAALEVKTGSEFSVPCLFSIDEWNNFHPTDRRVVGRIFNENVIDITNILYEEFDYLGKKSNIATYRRRKGKIKVAHRR